MINNEIHDAILRKFGKNIKKNMKKSTIPHHTTIDFSSKIMEPELANQIEFSIEDIESNIESNKGIESVSYKGLAVININEPDLKIGDKLTLVFYNTISNNNYPFLLFCLLKTNGILDFPNIEYKGGSPSSIALESIRNVFVEWPELQAEYKGYLRNGSKTYLFIEGNLSDEYKINYIKSSANWWFTLVSEIVNYKKVLNYPIDKTVIELFIKNPDLCYLNNSLGLSLEVPNVAYYGGYYKRIAYAAALGQRKEGPHTAFGPYYYFNSYPRAMRYAIWTVDFKPMEIDGEFITEKDSGKFVKGGIVRFAIFTGKHTMLLNRESDPDDDSKITQDLVKQNPGWFKDSIKTRDSDAKWIKNYDSIGLGNRTYFNNRSNKEKIFYNQQIIKNYNQQFPLAYYYIDTNQNTDDLTNIKIE